MMTETTYADTVREFIELKARHDELFQQLLKLDVEKHLMGDSIWQRCKSKTGEYEWRGSRQRKICGVGFYTRTYDCYVNKLKVANCATLELARMALLIETCAICGRDESTFEVDDGGMVWMACPHHANGMTICTPKLETIKEVMESWNQKMVNLASIINDVNTIVAVKGI